MLQFPRFHYQIKTTNNIADTITYKENVPTISIEIVPRIWTRICQTDRATQNNIETKDYKKNTNQNDHKPNYTIP